MPNALTGLLADPRGEMKAPPRNKLLGLLADALTAANDYAQRPDPTMPMGKANPVLGLLADAASLNSLATTAQRASYGERLTNGLRGSKAFLKPETADAVMMAPISPRNALAALGMVGGMADNGAMRAATVFHSSPYKFDKFAAGKVGTGEGNATFGVGTYLAESPEVSGVGGKYFDQFKRHPAVKETGGPYAYTVDLPDDVIGKMFDWDKPLKAQAPAVREAITKLARSDDQLMQAIKDNGFGDMKGSVLYSVLQDAYTKNAKRAAVLSGADATKFTHDDLTRFASGNNEFATEQLRSVGIPGIRYLDGVSRDTGAGTSNYVVFPGNESLLKILNRHTAP